MIEPEPRIDQPIEHIETICSVCGQDIYEGEKWGEFRGNTICSDCMEDEWRELSIEEKFYKLGYYVRG